MNHLHVTSGNDDKQPPATVHAPLKRLVLGGPYGPAVAQITTDPADPRVTYKISTETIGVIITVEPAYGGGHVAIPRGVDLHIACNGVRDAVTIAYISDRGDRSDIPAGLLPGSGVDEHLLAAVLRAVIRDWANRHDLHRLWRRAAARTAAERLPAAQRLLDELQVNLGCVLTELDDLHHVVAELRALAAEHRNQPYDTDPGTAPIPDSPIQRAERAAQAIAAHARHTDPGITTADLHIPTITRWAVTNLLTDLLHLLDQTDINPDEVMAAASEAYDTEQGESADDTDDAGHSKHADNR